METELRFYPYKVYTSLISSLKKILSRPGFLDICENNRYIMSQFSDPCSLVDVNDAKLWKDFLSYNGQPFLSEKYTYTFMINVDWFQPFKHRKYSVGVIYVVLMNLPREIRFKRENVIIVDLIQQSHLKWSDQLLLDTFGMWTAKTLEWCLFPDFWQNYDPRCTFMCWMWSSSWAKDMWISQLHG